MKKQGAETPLTHEERKALARLLEEQEKIMNEVTIRKDRVSPEEAMRRISENIRKDWQERR